MPKTSASGVASKEALDSIRKKLRIPAGHWDDLLGAVNGKGFTVAGATKAALIADLHEDITAAAKSGESIGQYRKRFDATAAKYGWTYKGRRGWRTRLIYDTNMRSAHMAGRWHQIQRTKKKRPFLGYWTVGDDRVRAQHKVWHGVILPADDSWWKTHYPPNDFGCRCYVIQYSERDLKRLGFSVTEKAPVIKMEPRINTRTGEIYPDTPEGIGTGWDYNVGMASTGADSTLGEALARLPQPLRKIAYDDVPRVVKESINPGLKSWASTLNPKVATSTAVGFIPADLIRATDSNALLVIESATAAAIPIALLRKLPKRLLNTLPIRDGDTFKWILDDVTMTATPTGPGGSWLLVKGG